MTRRRSKTSGSRMALEIPFVSPRLSCDTIRDIRSFHDPRLNERSTVCEHGFVNRFAQPWLTAGNPWLYQEFQLHKSRYTRIDACRMVHSLAKKEHVTPADYDAIDYALAAHGIEIEREWEPTDQDAAREIWQGWMGRMASNK